MCFKAINSIFSLDILLQSFETLKLMVCLLTKQFLCKQVEPTLHFLLIRLNLFHRWRWLLYYLLLWGWGLLSIFLRLSRSIFLFSLQFIISRGILFVHLLKLSFYFFFFSHILKLFQSLFISFLFCNFINLLLQFMFVHVLFCFPS